MPPSVNHLYQRRRGGQLALTEEAQRYIQVVNEDIVQQIGKVTKLPRGPEIIYRFDVILYFESLENPGWFEHWDEDKYYMKDSKDGEHKKGELKARKGERKAKTRYKQIDYDNRIKFLQDKVAKAVGIPDDSQIFIGHQEKREDPNRPRAEVMITTVNDTARFFPTRRS